MDIGNTLLNFAGTAIADLTGGTTPPATPGAVPAATQSQGSSNVPSNTSFSIPWWGWILLAAGFGGGIWILIKK